jgi:hypothetical protein
VERSVTVLALLRGWDSKIAQVDVLWFKVTL